MKSKVIENVFDTVEPSVKVKNVVLADKNTPDVTDSRWHDYVMGHFAEDELVDGKPLVAGLRRVTQLLMGRIVSSLPHTVIPPKSDDTIGRATVSWLVTLDNGQVFGDVASSWEGNTEQAFSVYVVETAATRAEARALRKALGLKIVSADEIADVKSLEVVKKFTKTTTEGEYDEQGRMTDPQANFINTKAKKLNINVEEFLQNDFGAQSAKKVSKKIASNAIDKLNEYQQNPAVIPDKIKGYLENWM